MVEERWRKEKAKKKKGKRQEKWGAKIWPPTIKATELLSQLSLIELTQSTHKKKRFFFF